MADKYEYARIAYTAYTGVGKNKNYQGLPMPEFDALPEKIKDAWRAVVSVIMSVCGCSVCAICDKPFDETDAGAVLEGPICGPCYAENSKPFSERNNNG